MEETTFEDLGVAQAIADNLRKQEITEPTDIQANAIPAVLEGRDVIGKSRTGSGKTAAFGVPLLQRLQAGKAAQALVLAPTRELAVQIANELRKWRKDTSVSTVYGGVGYDLQIQKMRKCEVIVATPGRLLDHLQQGNCDLSHLSMFVLDEADKMVEMGFIEDVERIMSFMPAEKQMLLFGATLSSEIQAIQQRHMQNPVVVEAKAMVEADA
ncbi:hypothetical protein COV94_04310, partial [Candidatus Woesearchaeota archaeon CG11_big_fil_rev_8_21_14_0_20_57_5]